MNQGLLQILTAHYQQKARTVLPLVVLLFLALLAAVFVVSILQVPDLRRLQAAPPYVTVAERIRQGKLVEGAPLRCQYPDLDAAAYERCIDAEKASAVRAAALILALPLGGFLGFVAYFIFLRRPVEQSPLYRLFAKERDHVVWVYELVTNVHAAGAYVGNFSSVCIGLRSGKELRLTPIGFAQDDVMRTLAYELPEATFGYSEGNQQTFKRDPASMRIT